MFEIEEHRQPWESDEHWVFRKEFMLAHQGKFSDDRLLCLAQVFANVELLGCTYPAAVMRQVNELAKDVKGLEEMRKKRIDMSTVKFVKASVSEGNNNNNNNRGNKRGGDSYPQQSKYPRPGDRQPHNRCEVVIGGQYFGESINENVKVAKLEAAKVTFANLQKKYYTVQIKEVICEDGGKVYKSSLMGGEGSEEAARENSAEGKSLDEDNVGFKMLRMMGWGGGGVGKKGNEGIAQPVSLKDVYKREGLGFMRGPGKEDFRKGVNEVIKDFVASGTCCDLAFSPEFSKEERMYIHRIAERYNLRNSSHGGKGPNRHVVLSRRFTPQQLVEHLMRSGGSTKKYELIPPTDY